MKSWKTARRTIGISRPLVMGVLNLTPDSFSDGGLFTNESEAVKQAEKLISDGADIIDIGGESSRPGSKQVTAEEEIRRVLPVIKAVCQRWDIPVSIDTWKSAVAGAAIDAGAEIINDISGLRFDSEMAALAARSGAGLVLMHSRGEFSTMHSQPPVYDVLSEVVENLSHSLEKARAAAVGDRQIVLDVGIGFGKTAEQNLELLARLDEVSRAFSGFPILVGASRKSFIGKVLGREEPRQRLYGSLASAAIAVFNGADIVRVHDVRESVEAVLIADAIRLRKSLAAAD
ncbi:MAG: dihydropteroate synthase [Pyrinomonadaceae bacterium]|jgi:dihydropteroate synthase